MSETDKADIDHEAGLSPAEITERIFAEYGGRTGMGPLIEPSSFTSELRLVPCDPPIPVPEGVAAIAQLSTLGGADHQWSEQHPARHEKSTDDGVADRSSQ